jgi:hypothetical protein
MRQLFLAYSPSIIILICVKEGEEDTIACKNTQIVGKEVRNVQKSQLSVAKIRQYYSAWMYTYRIFQI